MNNNPVLSFFKRALIYLSPILLLMLGMEMLQRRLPNDFSYKKAQLESNLEKIENLILGTSHTYMGINPSLFDEPSFNLAATAQSIYFDKFLFDKYHKQMPRLKRVFLPVSYSSLGSESYLNPGDFNKSYHYAFFYGSNAFINKLAPRRFSIVSLFTVKRSVDRSLDFYVENKKLVECDELGWYKGEVAPRDLQRNGADAGKFHDLYYSEELVPTNTAYLASIIEACKSSDIELYLLSMPMYKSYMENITMARYDVMVETLDSLSKAHEISYLNYTYDTSFAPEDFFDANHLNEQGANLFTKKLLRDIGEESQVPPLAEASH